MKINEIYLANFYQYKECSFHLSEGWTNIYGGNESGKTTLALFIKGILFGFKKLNRTRLLQDNAGGYLKVVIHNKEYKLERYLHYNRGRLTIIDEENDSIVGSDEKLNQLIKLDEKQYDQLFYFQPLMMTRQEMTEEEWQNYALSYALTGNQHLFKLEKKYQKALRRYQDKKTTKGKITQLLEKKNQLQQQIKVAVEREENQKKVTCREYEALVAKKVQLEQEIQLYEQYEALPKEQFEDLSTKDEEMIEQLLQQWAILERDSEETKWQTLMPNYKQLQKEVAYYQQLIKNQRLQTKVGYKKITLFLRIVAILIFLFSTYLAFNHHFLWGLLLVIVTIVLFFYSEQVASYIISQSNDQYIKRQERKINQLILSFQPTIICESDDLKSQLVEITAKLKRLKQVSSDDDHGQKRKRIIEQLSYFPMINTSSFSLAKQSFLFIKNQNQQSQDSKQRKRQLEIQLQQIPPLSQLKEQYHVIQQQVSEAYRYLQMNDDIDLETLYQRKAMVEEELYQVALQYEKTQLKLNWVNDLKEEGQRMLLPKVLQQASIYFSYLIQEANTKVFFKENKLYVKREKNYALSELSQGTKMQLIIALRLAFIVTQEKESVPIIMDEGWTFFDMERSEALFSLLEQISHRKQVITFSHYSLADYCQKEIQL